MGKNAMLGKGFAVSLQVGVAALLVVLLVVLAPDLNAARGPTVAAAAQDSLATKAAIHQMQEGGNAVDGAVAAAFVGGVTSPTSSGIGGGGFAIVWGARKKKVLVLDFRETAPAAIDLQAFETLPFPKDKRGQLVGVPGEVAGLYQLHKQFGTRSWRAVMEPAIRLARAGFAVNPHLAATLTSKRAAALQVDPMLSALYFPGGEPAAVGALIKSPKLAATLKIIANKGPDGFYTGAVAKDFVDTVVKAGGSMTLEDLANYKPVRREPIRADWAGHRVYTMPPPSAGGIMLAETFGLFSPKQLKALKPRRGLYKHLLAEGFRGAIADRFLYVGDPAFTPVPTDWLLSQEHLKPRRALIAPRETHTIADFLQKEFGTHHLVTADSFGNMVSLTTTVNRAFGLKMVAPETGVVLNDELDDFTPNVVSAKYGIANSPNRPRPGARPVSSMTPTIVVKDGKAVLAIGGSGGMAIATNVSQTVVDWLLHKPSAQKLVSARRFYIPIRKGTIALPPGSKPSLVRDLQSRGEVVTEQKFLTTGVQAIARKKGKLQAAGDPRKHASGMVEPRQAAVDATQ